MYAAALTGLLSARYDVLRSQPVLPQVKFEKFGHSVASILSGFRRLWHAESGGGPTAREGGHALGLGAAGALPLRGGKSRGKSVYKQWQSHVYRMVKGYEQRCVGCQDGADAKHGTAY